jgi:hypothetical protein
LRRQPNTAKKGEIPCAVRPEKAHFFVEGIREGVGQLGLIDHPNIARVHDWMAYLLLRLSADELIHGTAR